MCDDDDDVSENGAGRVVDYPVHTAEQET